MKEWIEINKAKVIAAFVILILVTIFFFYDLSVQDELIIKEESLLLNDNQNHNEDVVKKEIPINIMVDVKGAVKVPGVYLAVEGERVNDLIKKAGGFNIHADQNQVNLSEHVEDEMVIFVPLKDEFGVDSVSNLIGQQSKLLNLNKATQDELQTLPGIGPSKALSIIEYRETNGGFETKEDLMKISGIGEKTYEKLESLISVK